LCESHNGTDAFHVRSQASANRGTSGASGALRRPPASTVASPWYQAARGLQEKGISPPL
jgi:hypothetical protein